MSKKDFTAPYRQYGTLTLGTITGFYHRIQLSNGYAYWVNSNGKLSARQSRYADLALAEALRKEATELEAKYATATNVKV